MFVLVKVRSLDVEKAGKDVDEDLTDPGSHFVRLWTSEMNVEHENCHTDAEHYQNIIYFYFPRKTDLKVSRIMVKRTNLPRRGTTREVGGMISASRRKNTVRERRMLMERLTLTKTVLFNLHNISIH